LDLFNNPRLFQNSGFWNSFSGFNGKTRAFSRFFQELVQNQPGFGTSSPGWLFHKSCSFPPANLWFADGEIAAFSAEFAAGT
jgi:hypothetical protein